jgi:hypothetical protein
MARTKDMVFLPGVVVFAQGKLIGSGRSRLVETAAAVASLPLVGRVARREQREQSAGWGCRVSQMIPTRLAALGTLPAKGEG